MSVEKHIHSFSKLYSIYDDVPISFVDDTDLDGHLIYNICDSFQFHHQIDWDSRGSNKN